MSKTSLLWFIAALLMLVIAMAFDAYEAREKITALEKDNASLKVENEYHQVTIEKFENYIISNDL